MTVLFSCQGTRQRIWNIVLRTVCRRVFTKRIYRYFNPCRLGSRREKYMLRQNTELQEKTRKSTGTVCLPSHSLTIRESPPAPSGLSSTLMMAGDAQQEADGPAQSENLFRRSNLSGNKKSPAPLFVAIFKFFCYNYCTSILLCM